MGHFAKVVDGIVEHVIVAEQSDIDSERHGDPSLWIQTSYNTRGGVHYDPITYLPDGGTALRYNYASFGYHYDSVADAFYPPMPWQSDPTNPSYILNTTTYLWELKPEYANAKPETPLNSVDYWAWIEEKREWVYKDDLIPPTEENNP